MNLLLSENIPLRTTAIFGEFAEVSVLPHHYGDLSASPVPLIKLSATEYLLADHPVMAVTSVLIDDAPILAYAAQTATDDTGHAYAKITLSAPVPDGSKITATLKGKYHPTTGALMENPADIIEDIYRLSGKTESLPGLKSECAGLKVAGSLTEITSIREAIDRVSRSVGAIWTSGMARLYPVTAPIQSGIKQLDASNSSTPDLSAVLADTADSLRVAFDWCADKGEFAQFIELAANPSPYGAASSLPAHSVEAGWIRQAADAESLGRRMLARLAGNKLAVSLSTGLEGIEPGQWLLLDHPSFPAAGAQPMMVLGISLDPYKRDASLSGEVIYGAAPNIIITRVSKAIKPTIGGGVEIAYTNGIATFTILGPDNKPLINAQVSLDGSAAKKTNAKGQVSFDAKPGTHTLAVQASGFVPFEMEVTV